MATRKGADLSIAQLETLLAEKKGRVTALAHKRSSLQAELNSIDQELNSLQENASTAFLRKQDKRDNRKRQKNSEPLAAVVNRILEKKSGGLSLDDLTAQVISSGYKSNAKNFTNVVYQCVYNSAVIIRDKQTGTFRLKSPRKG